MGQLKGCKVAAIYQANKMIVNVDVLRIPSRNCDLAR